MSKLKKIIINISCGLLLIAVSFGAGSRFRLARVSGAGSELESRITDAGDSANRVKDGLNVADGLANGAATGGRAVDEGLTAIEQSSGKLGIFYNEVIRAIEADQEAERAFRQVHSEASGVSISALDIAIQHSEQYERLIESLQRASKNFEENSSESE